MARWRSAPLALVIGLTACGSAGTPVPVLGGERDIAALAGQWSGEYHSKVTGRSGGISFSLVAGQDTARGEVIMVPRATGVPQGASYDSTRAMSRTTSQSLQISFVRVTGGAISGRMDSYQEPECRCPALTSFEGKLRGDTLAGTFTTRLVNEGRQWGGEWWVVRSRVEP